MDRETPQWHVVCTKPRREKTAQRMLQQKRIQVFYPQLRILNPRPRQPHIVPLFPSYLFVLIVQREYQYVQWCAGVKNILEGTIEKEEVEKLIQKTETKGTLEASNPLQKGATVTIERGPFAGFIARIICIDNAQERVQALIHFMGDQKKVAIPTNTLTPRYSLIT